MLSMTLCGFCTGLGAQAQDLPKSSGAQVATVRLLAADRLQNGRYHAGIAIAMTSGSHTYWREPGDAGVPPVFAFNGSANVAKADVLFPVPTRIKEEGLEAFGYTDRVVLPVLVTPIDPSKPSTLHLDINYAVCNKICIPAKATADLDLPVMASAAQDAIVTAAFASVPMPLPEADRGDVRLSRISGAAKPSWTVTWAGNGTLDDVFAEAPEGTSFDTRQSGPGRVTLIVDQAVGGPGSKSVPVTLTLALRDRSVTSIQTLDLTAPGP